MSDFQLDMLWLAAMLTLTGVAMRNAAIIVLSLILSGWLAFG